MVRSVRSSSNRTYFIVLILSGCITFLILHSSPDVETVLDTYIEKLELFYILEFRACKRSLKNWIQEIITSFNKVDGRRISNGSIESVNARIKLIKYSSNGYTNFEIFRKRVLYSLNDTSSIKF